MTKKSRSRKGKRRGTSRRVASKRATAASRRLAKAITGGKKALAALKRSRKR
jgi:hypothetical protein